MSTWLRCHITACFRPGDRVNSTLERHTWGFASVLLLLFLACCTIEDLHIKMWNDEILTLYVAQQVSPVEIVKATKEGMDTTPPLYPIIVSAMRSIVRPDALAVRLPSTLGFASMLLCVLAFCRRRMSAVYAFIAALLAAIACSFYATEGRSYGMVLGCAAGALLCWQVAAECKPRVLWLTLLGLLLMLATALHYYSIFLLVPLGLGELVRWRSLKKPEVTIMIAMAPALAVLALHYPLIAGARKYLPHFWPPGIASWSQIPGFYLQFSLIPAGMIVMAFILLGIADSTKSRSLASQVATTPRTFPIHEWVAIVTLALMPIAVVVISKYTAHVFVFRYALWAVIGLAIVTASVLCVTSGEQRLIGPAALGLVLAICVTQQALGLRQAPALRQGEAARRALQSLPDRSEPIVIGYGHAFMELSYYAEPRLRERLVYPLSRGLDLRYKGFDLDFFLLSALRHRTRLHVVDLDAFLRSTPRFVLVVYPTDYLPRYLLAAGYRLTPTSSEPMPILYEVEAHGAGR